MRRLATPLTALLALLLVVPHVTVASTQLSIAAAGDPEFPERSYVLQADPPVAVERQDLTVRENGMSVAGLEVSSAASSQSGEFASVLVIDASLSVTGEAIEQAMKAARAFATHRAPGQQLGVIAFNSNREVLLPLTTDDEKIAAALARPPRLAARTNLHDAVAAAIDLLGEEGVEAGSVVVLSDGADTGSEASEEAVVDQAADEGVRVFVVGLESGRFDPDTLRGLAQAGEYATATEPRELAPIFSRFGAQRASEYLLRYRSAASRGEAVTVEVEVAGVPGMARAAYRVPRKRPVAIDADSGAGAGFWSSATAMVVAVGLAVLLLGAAALAVLGPRRESVLERLARFGVYSETPAPADADQSRREGRAGAGGPLAALEGSLEGSDRWERLKEALDVAGVRTPAVEIVAGTAAATLLVAILLAALAPFPLLALLAVLVPLAVRAAIERKLETVRERFAEELADNLQVVASAIRAGHSLIGALSVVEQEASGPARDEFRRIVSAERIGVPLEDAIRESARRMASRDMEQLALVAIIQRETGGNTAEIIDRVIETIRERAELRRMMSTLTAQGRLSRGVVTALPVALLIIITVLNPAYMAPLFETTGGQIALVVAGALVILGSLVIKRIVEVRV